MTDTTIDTTDFYKELALLGLLELTERLDREGWFYEQRSVVHQWGGRHYTANVYRHDHHHPNNHLGSGLHTTEDPALSLRRAYAAAVARCERQAKDHQERDAAALTPPPLTADALAVLRVMKRSGDAAQIVARLDERLGLPFPWARVQAAIQELVSAGCLAPLKSAPHRYTRLPHGYRVMRAIQRSQAAASAAPEQRRADVSPAPAPTEAEALED